VKMTGFHCIGKASNIGVLLTTFHKIGNAIERLMGRQLVAILSVVRLGCDCEQLRMSFRKRYTRRCDCAVVADVSDNRNALRR
jgi:hypothetical protein